MNKGLTSKASVIIQSPLSKVWEALITPEIIKQYMFGSTVVSEWNVGSSIVWKGNYQGKEYEDKGVILQLEPERILQYTHFSPLAGKPDVPENYHTITIELSEQEEGTFVSLSQDNNSSEEAVEYTKKFWQGMLDTLKKVVEK